MHGSGATTDRLPPELRRASRIGALVALVLFAVLACGGRPSGLFERGPYTADFFDAQAEAILDGRLDVDPAVAGIEGFEHDGKTYLYFGLVPAILRLPVAAVSDSMDGRLVVVSMLGGLAVALYATSRLLWRARRWRRPDDPPLQRWEAPVFGVFVAAVGLASPLLFLGARPIVYHEVELWGAATALLALEALFHWWERPSGGRLVLASLTATIALSTRASVGGGAVAALALVLGVALLWRRVPWRTVPALALAVLVPLAAYSAGNMARFDRLFSVPFEEQAFADINARRKEVVENTDGTLFGAEFAPSNLATYLRPDGVALQRLFPWITFRESDTIIGDPLFDTTDRSASLPIVAPTFLALAAIGVGALVGRRGRDPWLAATAGTAMGLVATVTIAFIANRYLADFVPTLVLPATVGLWTVGHALDGASATRRRGAFVALGLVTVASAIVSALLALQAQRLLLFPGQEARRGFVGLQMDIDDTLHGAPPPDVTLSDALPNDDTPAPRGALHITQDQWCRALYWNDGEAWNPLELGGDLAFQLTGPIKAGTTELVVGDTWKLVAERTGDEVVLRYEPDDGPVREGPATTIDGADGHRFLVMLDPVRHVIITELDGDEVLRTFGARLPDTARPGADWGADPNPTPLCDRLADRVAEGTG